MRPNESPLTIVGNDDRKINDDGFPNVSRLIITPNSNTHFLVARFSEELLENNVFVSEPIFMPATPFIS
jgi:hypothetical protein